MRLLRIAIGVATIILTNGLFAQSPENFESLKSSGNIPDDFIIRSTDKSEADFDANDDKDLDKEFFLSTRFYIDELLLSGNMLFNEKLSKYLNSVAKYTLRAESKLYDQLRFYVLKSTVANAFSTDQGIIVFTTELLAQLENEAQLAYIIAHEVSHYTEHHVRSGYVERQNLKRGRGKYQRLDHDSRISQLSIYNQSNELDADNKGIDLYLRTEYDVNAVFTSFEMLLYSYLPFEDLMYDSTFLNTDILKIPGTFFPDTINQVSKEKNYDDKNSTHPNIEKRMDSAFDKIGSKTTKGDKKFVISEETFHEIQTLSRFENINLLLSEREYGKALYNVFLLSKSYPNNRFLDLSKVKALYGLAKYRNANRYSEVRERPKNIEGESYKLHTFLYEVSKEQLNVIAYRHAYDMSKKYPDDEVFKRYEKDMKKELACKSNIEFDDFASMNYDDYIASIEEKSIAFDVQDSIQKIENSDLSKYQKIRLKKELNDFSEDLNGSGPNKEENFHLYGLYDLVASNQLVEELKSLKKEAEELEVKEKAAAKNKKKNENPGLGIDHVVIVDPIFEQYKLDNKRDLKKSEKQKVDIASMFNNNYEGLNMQTSLLDSKYLGAKDVDSYNQIGIVFRWVEEVLNHEGIDMIASTNDQMDKLKTSFGTDHFMFTGAFAFKERGEFSTLHLYAILFPYALPFAIADLLIVHHNFELVAFSVNATTDKIEFATVKDVSLRAQPYVIQAYLYDVLYQLNQGN